MNSDLAGLIRDIDFWCFAVLPYLAFVLFFLMTIQRYRSQRFTYSSLSSQFLENRHHFWGMVPFHYGILLVLGAHFLGFLIPSAVLAWNGNPLRLYVLEVTGLVLGLLALVGLINTIVRRFANLKVRRVTTTADWVLYAILLFQLSSGVYVATAIRWGSSWFAASAAPYLWSLIKVAPDISYVTPLPWMAKLHIISAFVLVGFFPFTRLVHILVIPNPYLWRRPQVVRWNWNRATKAAERGRG